VAVLRTQVQTVDMEGVRCGQQGAAESFAAQLGASLSEIGFAILTGHGIDERLFGGCEAAVGQLFERPLPQKMAHRASRAPGCSVNSGYFPLHETSKLTPDWVEGWVFQRRAFHELAGRGGPRGQHARLQPADGGGVEPGGSFFPPGCEAVERQFTEYIQAMETLPPLVLAAMLRFLGAPVRDGGKVVHPPQLDGAAENSPTFPYFNRHDKN
jgi:isopenicillin N synthase-like dioxygenase